MLMVSRYSKDYVDACRAKVTAQLARLATAFFNAIEESYP